VSMLEGVGCVGPTDVCEMERGVQNEFKGEHVRPCKARE
jgi:hypothetical protein